VEGGGHHPVHHPHPLADVACLLRARRTPGRDPARRLGPGDLPARGPLVLRRAAAVVGAGQAHLALSTELIGHESKVEVIPVRHRPVALGRWSRRRHRARRPGRCSSDGSRPTRLDILLRALERVPDLPPDIVGSAPQGPRLRTLAQALAVSDRVRWYGEYPDEDLPRRMADADFLVLPSVTVEEMFGLVVL
jgi:glycosyltransferase involved in cell wall biosynthesis